MAQYNDTGYGTTTLSGTVSQFARVTAAGATASATQQDVGTAQVGGVSGDDVAVAYANKQGTTKMIANGAFTTLGAKLYTAAAGKVSTTQATGSFLAGLLMSTSAADGDIIEVQRIVGDSAGS
jgi:hypothetical protein